QTRLCSQLPREAPDRSANSHTNAELAAPARGARKQEEADIRRCNQGKEHAAREEKLQLALCIPLVGDVVDDALDGVEPGAEPAIDLGRVRIACLELIHDGSGRDAGTPANERWCPLVGHQVGGADEQWKRALERNPE